MSAAEKIFTDDWLNGSSECESNIDLKGFTYFTYTHNKEIFLSTGVLDISDEVNVYPNPVGGILYVGNVEDIVSVQVYNNNRQLIIEINEDKIDFTNITSGVYLLKVLTNKGIAIKKIIKS